MWYVVSEIRTGVFPIQQQNSYSYHRTSVACSSPIFRDVDKPKKDPEFEKSEKIFRITRNKNDWKTQQMQIIDHILK